jgi:hypothetical protein
MHEDDYTGVLDDDEFKDEFDFVDDDLPDWADDDSDFDDEFEVPEETNISVIDAVEGAKSLQDAAERLYVLADELLSLAAIGWELMDDMAEGKGVALMVGDGDIDDIDVSD